jgi:hypothetical protein
MISMIATIAKSMEQQQIIAGWEERARRAGVSISKVCERAKIHTPSFSKWKAGKNGITLCSIRRMEAALSEIETAHREASS